jgi:hypothetical protein
MNAHRTRTAIVVAGLALVAAACGGTETPSSPPSASAAPNPSPTQAASSSPSPSVEVASNPAPVVKGQPYQPDLPPPADFVAVVDNPYMPWIPGTKAVFEGVSDGQHERNVVVVTDRTKEILGVKTTVVHDQVFSNGQLTEDTLDRYAQDSAGNVWYFGEDTAEYKNGAVTSTAGSWEAGVDGAQPGVVMLAQPTVGEQYHQEYKKGEAEDLGKVIALDDSLTVPYGPLDQVVVTADTTPLEPQILEHKFYASGIGVVLERVVSGGQEISRLVSFTSPTNG